MKSAEERYDKVKEETNMNLEIERTEGNWKQLEQEMNMSWQISPIVKRTRLPSGAQSEDKITLRP